MSTNFLAIQHVSFVISNLKQSHDFYHGVLKLDIDNTRPDMSFDGYWFFINELQQIHLLLVDNVDPVERPEHGGRDRHAAFQVTNLAQITQRLEQRNVFYTMSKSGREGPFCQRSRW